MEVGGGAASMITAAANGSDVTAGDGDGSRSL